MGYVINLLVSGVDAWRFVYAACNGHLLIKNNSKCVSCWYNTGISSFLHHCSAYSVYILVPDSARYFINVLMARSILQRY